ncbi:MFS transporter [Niveispirillum sp. KHB5.9]|uniref:MFS transporter n=1 Tax=Niveispirillum sp. KHB5.9 TaxID=3400269 RepID=UPI003A88543C
MDRTIQWKSRYTVLAILFATSIVSFMDRMAMSVVIPYIKADFQLSALQSGMVMSAFFASYSLSQIPGGLLADRFGVRKVTTIAMLWWSVFTAITGAVSNFSHMLVTRFLFGLGEGVYPACAFKTVAMWFPKRERGTANAIMLSSSRMGAAIAPLAVVWIMSFGGWQTVFFSLCLPGILMALIFWIFIPGKPSESKRVSPQELQEIEADVEEVSTISKSKVGLPEVLKDPMILRFCFIYFTFDFAYWGFTSWLPTYLVEERGFSMVQMGMAASLPFIAGTLGCIGGGWISDRFFANNRRLPIILTPLISAVLLYLTYETQSVTLVMVYQTLSGFVLNFFFASFWALPISTVPRSRMGVTSGVINTAGQVAGFLSPVAVGYMLEITGGHFSLTFGVLVVSLLVVGAVALSIPTSARIARETASAD